MAGPSKADRQVSRLLDKDDEGGILALVREGAVGGDGVVTYAPTGQPVLLLPMAIIRGWTDLALELIARGADVNRLEQGQTPLMFACAFQNHQVLEALLEYGAKLDLRTPKGEGEADETALMMATEKADLRAVGRLLEAGADPKVLTYRKQSAVHAVLIPRPRAEVPEVVRALVAAGCPLLGTELHYPVCGRDVATARLLLDLGCPLNEPFGFNDYNGPKKGETPLTTAVRSQHTDENDLAELGLPSTEPQRLEITRLLLAAGADPDRPGPKGLTPLLIAVGQRHLGLAKMLVGAGADPDLVPPGGKGKSPAALAAEKGLDEFTQLFARDR